MLEILVSLGGVATVVVAFHPEWITNHLAHWIGWRDD